MKQEQRSFFRTFLHFHFRVVSDSEARAVHTYTREAPREQIASRASFEPVFERRGPENKGTREQEGDLKDSSERRTSTAVLLMAACSYSPVKCAGTFLNGFYFEVVAAEEDHHVDEDSFGISKQRLGFWVRSLENKFLLLNPEKQFQVQNLTSEELSQPECKFEIRIYRESPSAERKGMVAMLYVMCEGKFMVACCGQQRDVHPEEMDALPSDIATTDHKALFYMTSLSGNHAYEFESTVHRSSFLAFEPDGGNPSLNKLVLHAKGDDDVDEACEVILWKR